MPLCLCSDVYNHRHGEPDLEVPVFLALLTRFNLRIFDKTASWGAAKRESWLVRRIALFKAFTLPSVLNQSRRPDVWLLGVDGESRDALAPLLAAIGEHDWIVPVWQKRLDDRHEHSTTLFHREIARRLDSRCTHIVSTRLDSDDTINRSFFLDLFQYTAAAIRARPGLSDFWVSFPVGINYANGECGLFNYPTNHFISRVQTTERFGLGAAPTVFSINHENLFANERQVFLAITREPMWMQHAHGGNLTNRARGLPTLQSPEAIAASFGFANTPIRRLRHAFARRAFEMKRSLRRFGKTILRTFGLMEPKEVLKARRRELRKRRKDQTGPSHRLTRQRPSD